jgi:hypothetical protein
VRRGPEASSFRGSRDPANSAQCGSHTVVGGLASIGAQIVAQTLQSRREHSRWLMGKREEAYSNAIRYALRLLYNRSRVAATGLRALVKRCGNCFTSRLGIAG